MRTERKYRVITLMAALLTIVLLGTCLREPFRMKAATEHQREQYVMRGARIYAEQCVQCHGPKGEGVVGMPLNRAAFKVGMDSPSSDAVYSLIYKAADQGRPGNAEHPFWQAAPDGKWLSYTSMAAWGRTYGGPLDEEALRALAVFIMTPGGQQWSLVGDTVIAPFHEAAYPVDKEGKLRLPDAPGLDPQVNEAAKALLRDRTRSQCLNCHAVGESGARIGPDLSDLSRWGLDQKFVADFIRYANLPMHHETDKTILPHDRRMPVYWSENRAITGPQTRLDSPVVSEGPYYMLRFKGRLTDQEIESLAAYLVKMRVQ